jgi:post-segregation antitoxin (ccd killing protein)
MRHVKFDRKALKRTVSLTLNSDLFAQAKSLGINASNIAEQAISNEVDRVMTEKLKEEIKQDIDALDAYEKKHGAFIQMAREHYQAHEQHRK